MSDLDILARIDQAVGCQQCGRSLDGSVSDDFCSDSCQQKWHASRAVPLTSYREPVDLPQHVGNLIELDSPETRAPSFDGFHGLLTSTPQRDILAAMHRAAMERFAEQMRATAEQMRAVEEVQRATWAGVMSFVRDITDAPVVRHSDLVVADEVHLWQGSTLDSTIEYLRTLMASPITQPQILRAELDQAQLNELQPVEDARARALELRRNRNTGPAPQHRAPRQVDPRGSARRR